MIKVNFELTKSQNSHIIDSGAKVHAVPGNPKSGFDLLDKDAGRNLALYGGTNVEGYRGFVEITLDDITPTSVEFTYGDDPTMTREENRIELRQYIVRERDRRDSSGFESVQHRYEHYSKLLGVFDRIGENKGHSIVRRNTHPHRKKNFLHATEIVRGDTVRWRQPVPGVAARDGQSIATRVLVADVSRVRRHDDGSTRMISLVITKSFGADEWVTGTRVDMTESHILSHMGERREWVEEAIRSAAVGKIRRGMSARGTSQK